jgi:hypothetical protein
MTDDEMVATLRAKGWRIQPPLTQENCPHHNTRGSCGAGAGGYKSEWWCLDCGKRTTTEVLPTEQQKAMMSLPLMNL